MVSRTLTSSQGLGWQTVQATAYAVPPDIQEFEVRTEKLLLVLVTSGRFDLDRQQAGKWFTDSREPGSLCAVMPNTEIRVRWRTTSDLPMRSLHLQIDAIPPVTTLVPDERSLSDPLLVAGAWTLSRALTSGAPALYADSVAQALTAHLAFRTTGSAPRPDRPGPPLGTRQIDRIAEYMRAHLADNVTVDELAAVINVSKYHFIRTFATTTGLTPYRYLRRMRMQAGADLLRSTTQPIAGVAAKCGYLNPSHFATAFRSEYGVSPNQFRGHRPASHPNRSAGSAMTCAFTPRA